MAPMLYRKVRPPLPRFNIILSISAFRAHSVAVYKLPVRLEDMEFSDTECFNPFKVDVFQLGNVFMNLVNTYEGLETFRELPQKMTAIDPEAKRPTAADYLEVFERLLSLTAAELDAPVTLIPTPFSSDSSDTSGSADGNDSTSTNSGVLDRLSERSSDISQ
ncbi:hypothetical protein C8R44DRAFT_847388 [Mycena epipterygia]|nr:hypothetical protein C8R44DRAFT_847388 [Mycena epipterygia]